jgi:hypothetical protein
MLLRPDSISVLMTPLESLFSRLCSREDSSVILSFHGVNVDVGVAVALFVDDLLMLMLFTIRFTQHIVGIVYVKLCCCTSVAAANSCNSPR